MASCGFWPRHTHSNQFNKEPGHQSLKTLFTLYLTSDIEFNTPNICHIIVPRKATLHQVFYLSTWPAHWILLFDYTYALLFYHSIHLLFSTLFIKAFPFYNYAIKLDQVWYIGFFLLFHIDIFTNSHNLCLSPPSVVPCLWKLLIVLGLCFVNAGPHSSYLSTVFFITYRNINCIVPFSLEACLRVISLSRQTGR